MWGAFLLFFVPVGGGIPLGVIKARDAGVAPLLTAGVYLLSDVVLALTNEPMVQLFRWLGRHVPALGTLGAAFSRVTGAVGLKEDGPRGPLGLILLSFTVSMTTSRAAAAAAGHGFLPGWTLAIIGDMLYFAVLMASTLWLSGVFGDDRITIGAVLLGTWVIPLLLRRVRGKGTRRVASPRTAALSPSPATASVAPALSLEPVRAPRPAVRTHGGTAPHRPRSKRRH